MPSTLPGAADSACLPIRSLRRHALQRGVDGGEQHRGPVAALDAREPRQRGHALRDDAGMRRDPVVGQAIPGRELQHLDVGREERERARQRRHARPVAADHQQRWSPARSARAATARARSAITSPSAPSATLASVSGRSGASSSAGDFAIGQRPRLEVEIAHAGGTARCRARRGTALAPVTQASRSVSSASSSCSYSSSSASLQRADMRRRRSGP